MTTDFQKALATLRAADLTFLSPAGIAAESAPVTPKKSKRQRKPSRSAAPNQTSLAPSAVTMAPPEIPDTTLSVAAAVPSFPTASAGEHPYGDHPLPVFKPALIASTEDSPKPETAAPQPRTRNRPAHEWPPVGTRLQGDYFGTTYHAEIVTARKRLKSGKQIRLLDGPAQGKRLDSFSKAALIATARQRKAAKLGRKGMSSGWTFWRAEANNATKSSSSE